VCVRKALSLSMIMFISCLVYQYWHKAKRILGLRVISPLWQEHKFRASKRF
jgi:hypothetical protein